MLHEAIDAAQGFGACQYVKDGQPQCVVAQFAVKCGLAVEEMRGWTEYWFLIPDNYKVPQRMLDISGRLQDLQNIWDKRKMKYFDEVSARQAMHEYVNSL